MQTQCSILFLFNMYISISIQIQIFRGIINQICFLLPLFSYGFFSLKENKQAHWLIHFFYWCTQSFSSIHDVLVSFGRRVLCYPLYRHFELVTSAFNDTVKILQLGECSGPGSCTQPSLCLGLLKLPATFPFSMSYFLEKSIRFNFWTEGSLGSSASVVYFKCLWVAGLKTHINGNINLYCCQKPLLIENPIDIRTVREWSFKGKINAVPPHLSALPYVAVHKCEKENSDNKTAVMQCWQPMGFFSEEDSTWEVRNLLFF